ncbi:hypothetical protein [Arthrobacter celericrescens]|uniref:hypothetical protein n=1 Tax=Arthrobacter celericrescens TaxID=2320851 RepID=UPI000EA308A8|nr:hypothetical protein [Arthrobacter celericrescens]
MKPLRTPFGAFLPAAGLLGVVLALIAGILGMHIMSGAHAAHTAAVIKDAGTVDAATAEGDPGHAHHGSGLPEPRFTEAAPGAAPGAAQGAAGAVDSGTTQCSCSGSCSDQHAATACTPSLGTGTLSAPAPENGAHVPAPLQSGADAPRVAWTYRPGSPSPGELSISRT